MDVGFDPDDVLASPVTPFCEDFATPLEALTRATTNPHEDKGWIGGEGGHWEFLEFIPAKGGRKGRVEKNDVELKRVQRWELLQG